jgi:nucleotide-binding universal stress UspA family protein
MKTIIVFTDHSKRSEHATAYAIHLAKKIKANVLLSDAICVPNAVSALHADGSNESFADRPPVENNKLLSLCNSLENELTENSLPEKFSPTIYCQSEAMPFNEAINYLEETLDIAFIILGVDLYYGASSIMAGDTCAKVLEFTSCPVILVPEYAPIRYAEKYAYVADINDHNVSILTHLTKLADCSAAEVMLVNINGGRPLDKDQENALRSIMKETISQIDYGRIYYRHLPNNVLKSDVEWLMQDNRFEMLAMIHTKCNIISPLLQFDCSSKVIGNINVPLLIYPAVN